MFNVWIRKQSNLQIMLTALMSFSCFFMFSIGEASSGQELTIEDVKNIIPVIESYEKKLVNVYIESETWNESRMNPDEPWERTAYYMRGNSWVNGLSGSKIRVNVLKESIGKKNAKTPEVELSYSLCYNGTVGKKLYQSIKRGDTVRYRKEAEIYIKRPLELSSGKITTLTGTRYSMYFLFPEEQRGGSLSGFLKIATSDEMASKLPFEYSLEEFLGVECFKMYSSDEQKNSFTWWFEPEKGYALRGYKLVNGLNDGSEWLVSSVKVMKLEEVAEDVWYPIEAVEEKGPSREGEPYLKKVFIASQVTANNQEIDQQVFEIDIPPDYKIAVDETKPTP